MRIENGELRMENFNSLKTQLFHHAKKVFSTLNSQLSTQKGFTLIELLITIAIIGVLASVLIVNLQGFRERTRDTQRKKDLRTLQTALELYRADTSDYPASLPGCGSGFTNGGITYLTKIPCDPLTSNSYDYSVSGSIYTLFACIENVNDSEKDTTAQAGCSVASFTVQSP